jgi:hypothetical protein|tara:strand:- start:997 stop:1143 length:147 start_codon:yes stop_codon:yes gene_type:complete
MKLIFKKDNGTILEKEFKKEDIEAAKNNGWKEISKTKPKKKKVSKEDK